MSRLLAIGVVVFWGSTAAVGQVIYNNASTVGEGYQRGMASVISASGEAALNASQARINNQDAYSQAIDNSVKSVNAFWEKKDIYSERQQQEFAKIQGKRSAYMERHGLGYLTPEDFDRTTGAINWPKVLTQTDYNQYRNIYDELFKARAYNGALTGDQYMQAKSVSKEWRAMLSKQKDVYPSSILSQMIRFVLKLDRELDDNLG
jgi:hypothetical protein